ncbi:Crp/Fnr family transcriptional regulator [Listeria fleischmannii]|uniref:Putative CRP/FNR family transcriptional regulator n=1 Tax=Listeria fleischmannii FSL S10-1203 TaxID=1265822 RepID=W7DBQ5_9LIST|nr:Crp/Fnr family transcriptional regulator [Listeria fleischmannii]EUJ46525.1 putative CRP/FNR family transcriptional regulator [Listeria fleischmannii FSL S10-1203]
MVLGKGTEEAQELSLSEVLYETNATKLPYSRLRIKRGENILLEGENHPYFYIIVDGVATMSKNTCKENSILSFLGKGEGIGFLHIENEAVSPVTYTAISEITVHRFPRDYARRRFTSHTSFSIFTQMNRIVLPILARESEAHLPSDQKVLAGLIHIGDQFGRLEEDGSCLIPYFFTQKILGSYLNLARAYVATNLRKLEDEGILMLSPKPWRINDFHTHKMNLEKLLND